MPSVQPTASHSPSASTVQNNLQRLATLADQATGRAPAPKGVNLASADGIWSEELNSGIDRTIDQAENPNAAPRTTTHRQGDFTVTMRCGPLGRNTDERDHIYDMNHPENQERFAPVTVTGNVHTPHYSGDLNTEASPTGGARFDQKPLGHMDANGKGIYCDSLFHMQAELNSGQGTTFEFTAYHGRQGGATGWLIEGRDTHGVVSAAEVKNLANVHLNRWAREQRTNLEQQAEPTPAADNHSNLEPGS